MRFFGNAFLTFLVALTFVACGGSSNDSANTGDGGATASAPTFTVTTGDGQVTISETVGSGRIDALTDGCSYNVYIASVSGVTADNYSSLADGAMYSAVAFPYTISGLDNSKTYYVVVTEVCDGVESTTMDETSASPSDGTVTTTGDDTSGMTPESIDVTGATAGVEEVEVTWSAPSDFVKTSSEYTTETYMVCWEAGANPDASSPCEEVGRGENSYTAQGLTGGQEYCFAVKQRKDQIGDSAFGATMCATPTAPPVPGLCDGDPLLAGLFPDANLQACVDTKGWTYVSDHTVSLVCNNKGIADITGLQCLTGLKNLQLQGNSIVDISPLSGLTNLSTLLNLSDNSIVDISPLSGLTNLRGLWLSNNSIVDISPLSGLTNLQGLLSLSNNSIVDASPLSGLTGLKRLWFANNKIVNVNPLSNPMNLTNLDLKSNNIGGQGVGNVDSLTTLTNITTRNYLKLSSNVGMSCGELGALQAAPFVGPAVNPTTAINGTDCTNP